MDAAQEILDRFNRMRDERDEAHRKLAALDAILMPAIRRAEAQSPLELRVIVLGAALREVAPLLTPDQRAELAHILTEEGPCPQP